MWVTYSKFFWYMVFISYGTGVVHTLSYLLFSVAPDLLHCRCMGEHRHVVQLFTSSQVREASQQFVRNLELGLCVASLHLTSVERYQVKNLNHVFDILLCYEDSHLICKQSRSDFFPHRLHPETLWATRTNMQITQPHQDVNWLIILLVITCQNKVGEVIQQNGINGFEWHQKWVFNFLWSDYFFR